MHNCIPRKSLAMLLVFVFGSGLVSRAVAEPDPQDEVNKSFKQADAQLNTIYQRMLKAIVRSDTRDNFIKAQRAWISFRDAEAEFRASSGARGGIAFATDFMAERTHLTEERIQQLKRHQGEYPNWNKSAP
jgi:uncharacterized protein YecT (DUF1311 family)